MLAEAAVEIEPVDIVPGVVEDTGAPGCAILLITGLAVQGCFRVVDEFQDVEGVYAEHRSELETFQDGVGHGRVPVEGHAPLGVVAQVAFRDRRIDELPQARIVTVCTFAVVIVQPRGDPVEVVRREDGDDAVVRVGDGCDVVDVVGEGQVEVHRQPLRKLVLGAVPQRETFLVVAFLDQVLSVIVHR